MEVERTWTEAHLKGDIATIEGMMGEGYVKIQPDGLVANKVEVLFHLTRINMKFQQKIPQKFNKQSDKGLILR